MDLQAGWNIEHITVLTVTTTKLFLNTCSHKYNQKLKITVGTPTHNYFSLGFLFFFCNLSSRQNAGDKSGNRLEQVPCYARALCFALLCCESPAACLPFQTYLQRFAAKYGQLITLSKFPLHCTALDMCPMWIRSLSACILQMKYIQAYLILLWVFFRLHLPKTYHSDLHQLCLHCDLKAWREMEMQGRVAKRTASLIIEIHPSCIP